MKTTFAATLAAAALLSTAAFAGSESSHNDYPVAQASVQPSVSGGVQVLSHAPRALFAAAPAEGSQDPARTAASGK